MNPKQSRQTVQNTHLEDGMTVLAVDECGRDRTVRIDTVFVDIIFSDLETSDRTYLAEAHGGGIILWQNFLGSPSRCFWFGHLESLAQFLWHRREAADVLLLASLDMLTLSLPPRSPRPLATS